MKQAYVERPGYRGETDISICQTLIPEQEAAFAQELMRQLAIATAHLCGEDSSGRQKLRLLTPDEIVERACEISAKSYAEFAKRGWLLEVPLPSPPSKEL